MIVIAVQGSKRSRPGAQSLSATTNIPGQDVYMSDFGSMEVNNSAITRAENEPLGSYWDWGDNDEENRGMEMDIQALLSEFGDFGDFFETDDLPFGEVFEYF